MPLIKLEAVQHDSDEREPVFILAAAVVSIRGAGGTWKGKVSLIQTNRDIPEITVYGSVAEVGALIMDAMQTEVQS